MNQMRCCVWLVCLIHTATKPSAVQAGDMEVQPQFSPCIQTLGDSRRRGRGWLEFYPSLLEGVASSLPQNSLASHISLSLTSLIESRKARVLSVPLYSGGGGGNTSDFYLHPLLSGYTVLEENSDLSQKQFLKSSASLSFS